MPNSRPHSYTTNGCDVRVVPGGALFCECATQEQALNVAMMLNQLSARLKQSHGPENGNSVRLSSSLARELLDCCIAYGWTDLQRALEASLSATSRQE